MDALDIINQPFVCVTLTAQLGGPITINARTVTSIHAAHGGKAGIVVRTVDGNALLVRETHDQVKAAIEEALGPVKIVSPEVKPLEVTTKAGKKGGDSKP